MPPAGGLQDCQQGVAVLMAVYDPAAGYQNYQQWAASGNLGSGAFGLQAGYVIPDGYHWVQTAWGENKLIGPDGSEVSLRDPSGALNPLFYPSVPKPAATSSAPAAAPLSGALPQSPVNAGVLAGTLPTDPSLAQPAAGFSRTPLSNPAVRAARIVSQLGQ